MSTTIDRKRTPEERELEKKASELEALQSRLADAELELATLRAGLNDFERRYLRIVGSKYAELDEIEAQIAELIAAMDPNDKGKQESATQARVQANTTTKEAEESTENKDKPDFHPSDELKKLYREVAKLIHPDLSDNEKDRLLRHKLMAEANKAYAEGNIERLKEILREWKSSPEAVQGEGTGAELVRIIRKIAQMENRLEAISDEMNRIQESDIFKLQARAKDSEKEGLDLLADLSMKIDFQIVAAGERLNMLRRKRPMA